MRGSAARHRPAVAGSRRGRFRDHGRLVSARLEPGRPWPDAWPLAAVPRGVHHHRRGCLPGIARRDAHLGRPLRSRCCSSGSHLSPRSKKPTFASGHSANRRLRAPSCARPARSLRRPRPEPAPHFDLPAGRLRGFGHRVVGGITPGETPGCRLAGCLAALPGQAVTAARPSASLRQNRQAQRVRQAGAAWFGRVSVGGLDKEGDRAEAAGQARK